MGENKEKIKFIEVIYIDRKFATDLLFYVRAELKKGYEEKNWKKIEEIIERLDIELGRSVEELIID